ncbi:hypothetical protein GDO81_014263 [Engystomops pustulosus]|uniref:Uncharacterized protein n=1 Tax=Engystomops pustulosus TaxID=76066 RepID=A0AAV7B945_ENGPU|nr:hypothetical protein GDO81_014263 [Engystomops pustulosus]
MTVRFYPTPKDFLFLFSCLRSVLAFLPYSNGFGVCVIKMDAVFFSCILSFVSIKGLTDRSMGSLVIMRLVAWVVWVWYLQVRCDCHVLNCFIT